MDMTIDRPAAARKLQLHSALDARSLDALTVFLKSSKAYKRTAVIARAGDATTLISILDSGFASRATTLSGGRRVIHAILLPGDVVDIETTLLTTRTDNIEALSACTVYLVPKARLTALPAVNEQLAAALLREATISSAIAREWVVNISGRKAVERVAHLLSELYYRMDAMGMSDRGSCPFPLSQQVLADAQGLTAVHANRVLQHLRTRKLVEIKSRRLVILDIPRLHDLADFDPSYLHYRAQSNAFGSPPSGGRYAAAASVS